jgi:8-oxo-dGTP pyrophosphatase MutT (NUDIX family)
LLQSWHFLIAFFVSSVYHDKQGHTIAHIESSIMPPILIRKAYGYITRTQHGRRQVAVFRHPLLSISEGGIQIPKGTVHEQETPLAAVQREIIEETGLTDFTIEGEIAVDLWQSQSHPDKPPEIHERHFFLLTTGHTLNEWKHVVTGQGEDEGMIFHYFWISTLDEVELAHGHADYLHLVFV